MKDTLGINLYGLRIGVIKYPNYNSAKYHIGIEWVGKITILGIKKIKKLRLGLTIWTD